MKKFKKWVKLQVSRFVTCGTKDNGVIIGDYKLVVEDDKLFIKKEK